MYQALTDLLNKEQIPFRACVSGGELTTFRTGGSVDLVIEVRNRNQLVLVMNSIGEYRHRILGNGSNILIGGNGYRGIIVKLLSSGEDIKTEGTLLTAFSGALLSRCATVALEAGLSGMECLHGIPGSVGGAVYMNAGAYGGTVADILESSFAVTEAGERIISSSEHHFSYRESIYRKNPGWVVGEASFRLTPKDPKEISEKMKELAARRRSSQPLEFPSAGSVFKRPEGYFAGKLIEDAGLKGVSVGGAQVSPKHAGFIVNADHASPEDVLNLIRLVQKRVYEQTGVRLCREVELLGDFRGIEGDLWNS